MKKIKHIETGLVIDLEEMKQRAGTENQLVIHYRNETGFDHRAIKNGSIELKDGIGPKDNFIQVERYEFDFGLCGLLGFKCVDQYLLPIELRILINVLSRSDYGRKEESVQLIEKLHELLMEAEQNELR